ncbi:mucin-5AC-like [Protopterus annectens]|uniref:mucin-5AC-like n=1 Tax=Protopterus annectens TaxID=7888 RepID=UPI001CFB1669|nr:mucin-5AC-like [Protopterus annectens]
MGTMGPKQGVSLWFFALAVMQHHFVLGQQEKFSVTGESVTLISPMTTAPVMKALNPSHSGRVCSTWGNVHYKTFDGDIIYFPGTCNYLFTSNCKNTFEDFNIQITHSTDEELPTISRIAMKLSGMFIEMANAIVSVNGENVLLPFSQSGIMITGSSTGIKVSTKLGFEANWNGEDAFMVELDNKYSNQTCGLCGDFNGIQTYNEFVPNGNLLTNYQYGNLQKVNGPTEMCQDILPTSTPSCLDYKQYCEDILLGEAFADCNLQLAVEPYVQACMQDKCSCNGTSNPFCFCHTIAEYSRQCSHSGGQPKEWRTTDLCYKTCPYNMAYFECRTPCFDTCSNFDRAALCKEHCTGGCFCPQGTVFDDIQNSGCIKIEDCFCVLDGKAYAPSESYTTECRTCTCSGGQWLCSDLPCPGICTLNGGSHVTTFDKKAYTFHGNCFYVFSEDSVSSSFAVVPKLVTCGITETETCLKKVFIYLNERTTVVTVTSSGAVLIDHVLRALPFSAGNFSVMMPSTFFIIMETSFGLRIEIQLQPLMQIVLILDPTYKGQTFGLCGNFNDDQTDDFKTRNGLLEGSAAGFATSCKAQSGCNDVTDTYENPCTLSMENEEYATHWCSLLTDSNGRFAECHSTVDPKGYYKNCVYDSCNCEDSEECMCAALSSYVRACVNKGVIITEWRENVCEKYAKLCPEGMVYSYNVTSCEKSCRALNFQDVTCDIQFASVDGCVCEEGTYLTEDDTCVPKESCPCYYKSLVIQPGEVLHDSGIPCTCTQGKLDCIGSIPEVTECNAPLVYFNCSNFQGSVSPPGADCQKNCKTLDMECYSTGCVSGCVCPDNLVLTDSGDCIYEDQCPCYHNGEAFQEGEQITADCNTCTCVARQWQCTDKICQGTCSIYGEGHYITFDGKRFTFNGECEYVLAQDYCFNNEGYGTFRVITENVPCGTTGTTCSKAIKIVLGSTELRLSDGDFQVVKRDTYVDVPYSIKYLGLFLAVEASNGVRVFWDKKTTVLIKLEPTFQTNICGLCGNYNGKTFDDFTTRSQSVVVDVFELGNSWKVSTTCPDKTSERDPCTANPYRQAWAKRQCSIIKSNVFSSCHSQVDPSSYYDACVQDACACDTGGDCQCFCTAVAAYATACNGAGVCVTWRSPEICPEFCEYYNPPHGCEWSYKPCGAPCMKTCRNPEGICSNVLPAIEGCYPECPDDRPFFQEESMSCVPIEECGCYDDVGNHYKNGETVPSLENCVSCLCTMNGINCQQNDTACYCNYDGKKYPFGEVIYHTTDGMGDCILAMCGPNGTIDRQLEACSTTAPTTTFHFSSTTSQGYPTITPSEISTEVTKTSLSTEERSTESSTSTHISTSQLRTPSTAYSTTVQKESKPPASLATAAVSTLTTPPASSHTPVSVSATPSASSLVTPHGETSGKGEVTTSVMTSESSQYTQKIRPSPSQTQKTSAAQETTTSPLPTPFTKSSASEKTTPVIISETTGVSTEITETSPGTVQRVTHSSAVSEQTIPSYPRSSPEGQSTSPSEKSKPYVSPSLTAETLLTSPLVVSQTAVSETGPSYVSSPSTTSVASKPPSPPTVTAVTEKTPQILISETARVSTEITETSPGTVQRVTHSPAVSEQTTPSYPRSSPEGQSTSPSERSKPYVSPSVTAETLLTSPPIVSQTAVSETGPSYVSSPETSPEKSAAPSTTSVVSKPPSPPTVTAVTEKTTPILISETARVSTEITETSPGTAQRVTHSPAVSEQTTPSYPRSSPEGQSTLPSEKSKPYVSPSVTAETLLTSPLIVSQTAVSETGPSYVSSPETSPGKSAAPSTTSVVSKPPSPPTVTAVTEKSTPVLITETARASTEITETSPGTVQRVTYSPVVSEQTTPSYPRSSPEGQSTSPSERSKPYVSPSVTAETLLTSPPEVSQTAVSETGPSYVSSPETSPGKSAVPSTTSVVSKPPSPPTATAATEKTTPILISETARVSTEITETSPGTVQRVTHSPAVSEQTTPSYPRSSPEVQSTSPSERSKPYVSPSVTTETLLTSPPIVSQTAVSETGPSYVSSPETSPGKSVAPSTTSVVSKPPSPPTVTAVTEKTTPILISETARVSTEITETSPGTVQRVTHSPAISGQTTPSYPRSSPEGQSTSPSEKSKPYVSPSVTAETLLTSPPIVSQTAVSETGPAYVSSPETSPGKSAAPSSTSVVSKPPSPPTVTAVTEKTTPVLISETARVSTEITETSPGTVQRVTHSPAVSEQTTPSYPRSSPEGQSTSPSERSKPYVSPSVTAETLLTSPPEVSQTAVSETGPSYVSSPETSPGKSAVPSTTSVVSKPPSPPTAATEKTTPILISETARVSTEITETSPGTVQRVTHSPAVSEQTTPSYPRSSPEGQSTSPSERSKPYVSPIPSSTSVVSKPPSPPTVTAVTEKTTPVLISETARVSTEITETSPGTVQRVTHSPAVSEQTTPSYPRSSPEGQSTSPSERSKPYVSPSVTAETLLTSPPEVSQTAVSETGPSYVSSPETSPGKSAVPSTTSVVSKPPSPPTATAATEKTTPILISETARVSTEITETSPGTVQRVTHSPAVSEQTTPSYPRSSPEGQSTSPSERSKPYVSPIPSSTSVVSKPPSPPTVTAVTEKTTPVLISETARVSTEITETSPGTVQRVTHSPAVSEQTTPSYPRSSPEGQSTSPSERSKPYVSPSVTAETLLTSPPEVSQTAVSETGPSYVSSPETSPGKSAVPSTTSVVSKPPSPPTATAATEKTTPILISETARVSTEITETSPGTVQRVTHSPAVSEQTTPSYPRSSPEGQSTSPSERSKPYVSPSVTAETLLTSPPEVSQTAVSETGPSYVSSPETSPGKSAVPSSTSVVSKPPSPPTVTAVTEKTTPVLISETARVSTEITETSPGTVQRVTHSPAVSEQTTPSYPRSSPEGQSTSPSERSKPYVSPSVTAETLLTLPPEVSQTAVSETGPSYVSSPETSPGKSVAPSTTSVVSKPPSPPTVTAVTEKTTPILISETARVSTEITETSPGTVQRVTHSPAISGQTTPSYPRSSPEGQSTSPSEKSKPYVSPSVTAETLLTSPPIVSQTAVSETGPAYVSSPETSPGKSAAPSSTSVVSKPPSPPTVTAVTEKTTPVLISETARVSTEITETSPGTVQRVTHSPAVSEQTTPSYPRSSPEGQSTSPSERSKPYVSPSVTAESLLTSPPIVSQTAVSETRPSYVSSPETSPGKSAAPSSTSVVSKPPSPPTVTAVTEKTTPVLLSGTTRVSTEITETSPGTVQRVTHSPAVSEQTTPSYPRSSPEGQSTSPTERSKPYVSPSVTAETLLTSPLVVSPTAVSETEPSYVSSPEISPGKSAAPSPTSVVSKPPSPPTVTAVTEKTTPVLFSETTRVSTEITETSPGTVQRVTHSPAVSEQTTPSYPRSSPEGQSTSPSERSKPYLSPSMTAETLLTSPPIVSQTAVSETGPSYVSSPETSPGKSAAPLATSVVSKPPSPPTVTAITEKTTPVLISETTRVSTEITETSPGTVQRVTHSPAVSEQTTPSYPRSSPEGQSTSPSEKSKPYVSPSVTAETLLTSPPIVSQTAVSETGPSYISSPETSPGKSVAPSVTSLLSTSLPRFSTVTSKATELSSRISQSSPGITENIPSSLVTSVITKISLTTPPVASQTAVSETVLPSTSPHETVPGEFTVQSTPSITSESSHAILTSSLSTASMSSVITSESVIPPTANKTTFGPMSSTVTKVTAKCFCIVNSIYFFPGETIYNKTDKSGWCYSALCSENCEIEKHNEPCMSPTTVPATTVPVTIVPATTVPVTSVSPSTVSTPAATESPSTPASTVSYDCNNLVPPRKYNETWVVDKCTNATCLGDCVYMTRVTCPATETVTCISGRPPVEVYDDSGCCFKYECEDVCSGWAKSHFMTFNGTYYNFQGDCSYVLMKEIRSTFNLQINMINNYCAAWTGTSCPQAIEILYGPSKVLISQQNLNGKQSDLVLFNQKKVTPAFENEGIRITSASMDITVQISELGTDVTFSQQHFAMKIPQTKFAGNTEGLCGTYSSESSEGCRMPDGTTAHSCSEMAENWRIPDKNNPYCQSISPTTTLPPLQTVSPIAPPPSSSLAPGTGSPLVPSGLPSISSMLPAASSQVPGIATNVPIGSNGLSNAPSGSPTSLAKTGLPNLPSGLSTVPHGIPTGATGLPSGSSELPNVPSGLPLVTAGLPSGQASSVNVPSGLPTGSTVPNVPSSLPYVSTGLPSGPSSPINVPSGLPTGSEGSANIPSGLPHVTTSLPSGQASSVNGLPTGPGLPNVPSSLPYVPTSLPANSVNVPSALPTGSAGSVNVPSGLPYVTSGLPSGPATSVNVPSALPTGSAGSVNVPSGLPYGTSGLPSGSVSSVNVPSGLPTGSAGSVNVPSGLPYGTSGLPSGSVSSVNVPSGLPTGSGLINVPSALPYVTTRLSSGLASSLNVPSSLPAGSATSAYVPGALSTTISGLPTASSRLPAIATSLPNIPVSLPAGSVTLSSVPSGIQTGSPILPNVPTGAASVSVSLSNIPTHLQTGSVIFPTRSSSLPNSPAGLPNGTAPSPGVSASLPAGSGGLHTESTGIPSPVSSSPNVPSGLITNSASLSSIAAGLASETTGLPHVQTSLQNRTSNLPYASTVLQSTLTSQPAGSSGQSHLSTVLSFATNGTSPVAVTTKPTCSTPLPLCSLITSSVFSECHKLISPEPFYQACAKDGCKLSTASPQFSNKTSTEDCTTLQAYASTCAHLGVCIDWRGQTGGKCEMQCPSGKEYKACGPKVQPTCNSGYNDKYVQSDDDNYAEGCFCQDGKILFNTYLDICVSTCGCTGPDGMPREPGDTWKSNCLDCQCDNITMTVQCKPRACYPSSNTCTQEGFVPITVKDPENPCCNKTECRCNTSLCSKTPQGCKPGFHVVATLPEAACCTVYKYEPKGVCVFNDTEYEPNAVIPQNTCDKCYCSKTTDPVTQLNNIVCAPVQCDKSCKPSFEYRTVPGKCCGECIQTSCLIVLPNNSTQLLKPGEKWSPSNDNCTQYTCTLVNGQYILLTNKKQCPPFTASECAQGSVVWDSAGCCAKCNSTIKKCGVQKKMDFITYNGCTSTKAVLITSCQGACVTSSYLTFGPEVITSKWWLFWTTSQLKYTMQATEIESACTCCQQTKYHLVDVELTCPEKQGKKVKFSYIYIDECGCSTVPCSES